MAYTTADNDDPVEKVRQKRGETLKFATHQLAVASPVTVVLKLSVWKRDFRGESKQGWMATAIPVLCQDDLMQYPGTCSDTSWHGTIIVTHLLWLTCRVALDAYFSFTLRLHEAIENAEDPDDVEFAKNFKETVWEPLNEYLTNGVQEWLAEGIRCDANLLACFIN